MNGERRHEEDELPLCRGTRHSNRINGEGEEEQWLSISGEILIYNYIYLVDKLQIYKELSNK
jgi:hypothetical protein